MCDYQNSKFKMKKSTINYKGVDYAVRTLDIRSIAGFEDDFYQDMQVADRALWEAIEQDYEAGDKEAVGIDNSIFYYLPTELIQKSDAEIIRFLEIQNL